MVIAGEFSVQFKVNWEFFLLLFLGIISFDICLLLRFTGISLLYARQFTADKNPHLPVWNSIQLYRFKILNDFIIIYLIACLCELTLIENTQEPTHKVTQSVNRIYHRYSKNRHKNIFYNLTITLINIDIWMTLSYYASCSRVEALNLNLVLLRCICVQKWSSSNPTLWIDIFTG